MRPTLEGIFMNLAHALKARSTCLRASVGCVITSEDMTRVYGVGYNGNYRGGPNECDSSEPGNCGDLHAEENALLKTSEGPHINKVMFVTMSPCIMCAKRIINKGGFVQIYYDKEYRDTSGIDLLKSQGIKVNRMTFCRTTHQYRVIKRCIESTY